jgi:hypothetical protein
VLFEFVASFGDGGMSRLHRGAELAAKLDDWESEVAVFGSGQKTLERQRFHFPPDWTYLDQVENEP